MRRNVLGLLLIGSLAATGCSRQDAAETRQQAAQAGQTVTAEAGDAWVTTKVEARFFASPEVKGRHIDVDTRNGVVTLTGQVDTDATRQQALALARDVDGVREVRDQLRVAAPAAVATTGDRPAEPATAANSGEPVSDDQLTARVQSGFYRDDDLRRSSIDVAAASGVVTLKGTVASEDRRRQALSVARQVPGVTDVRDELQVDPTVPPLPGGDPGARAAGEASDAWITTKVQARYYLDPDIKGRRVDVTTSGGVVTLTGSVATEAERQRAVKVARETENVTRVVDQLTVGTDAGR